MERYTTITLNNYELADLTRVINKHHLNPIESIQRKLFSYNITLLESHAEKIMYFLDPCGLKDIIQQAGNVSFGW